MRAWDSFDPLVIPAPSGCVAFNHEPNTTAASGHCETARERHPSGEAVHRERRSTTSTHSAKVRKMLGEDNARVLDALGAFDEVSALIMTPDDDEFALGVDWVDTTIEVCLDSGCCDHVMHIDDAPGYHAFMVDSPGNKRQQKYIVGNGERVPNQGQVFLNMDSVADGSTQKVQSCFQIAAVTRPLMSVGRICDQGLVCQFDEREAFIMDKGGKKLVRFERQSGLYLAQMKLRAPEGFARPQ